MGKVQDVTDATFEQEVLRSSLPVLIDLWALVWSL
jgi:thioredoxin-like negative regulator of GroEL